MLERVSLPAGVVVYQSPKLRAVGVPHAFSTRIGGVSAGAFASLNLGNPNGCPVQDDKANIAANYERLHHAIGCGDRPRAQVHQVHGCGIAIAANDAPFDIHQQADAIVSEDPRQLLSVRVADCVPVLLASRNGKRVAAIHAGWRGVIDGVVPAALPHFDDPSSVIAAIGPSIGYDAFEVGPEVLEAFYARFGAGAPVRKTPDGKGRVDLREAIRRQLGANGVTNDRVDSTDRCTYTHADEFFSHRRENGVTGRLAAVIGAIG